VEVSARLPAATIREQATVLGKTPGYELRLSFTDVSPATLSVIKNLGG
jgi:hypothetical protein